MTGIYLDSPAIVKLVIQESETDKLVQYLDRRPHRVTCGLVRVDEVRAVYPLGPAFVDAARAATSDVDAECDSLYCHTLIVFSPLATTSKSRRSAVNVSPP